MQPNPLFSMFGPGGPMPPGLPGGMPQGQPPNPLLDALGGDGPSAQPMAMAPPTGAMPPDVLMALMAQLRSAGM